MWTKGKGDREMEGWRSGGIAEWIVCFGGLVGLGGCWSGCSCLSVCLSIRLSILVCLCRFVKSYIFFQLFVIVITMIIIIVFYCYWEIIIITSLARGINGSNIASRNSHQKPIILRICAC